MHITLMVSPKVTDCELVVDSTRFVATHRYSPISIDAILLMVSDGVLSVELRFAPLNNQWIFVKAGEPWVTLAVHWMVRVVPVSDIVPGTSTFGFS